MATSTQSIIDRAAKLLLDEGATRRWAEDELLEFLNMGQNEIVLLKPDSYSIIACYRMVSGTRQRLPDGTNVYQDPDGNTLPIGIAVIKIVRCMGANGLTPGRIVSIIDQDILDQLDPDWHSSTESDLTVHYTYNAKAPKYFYLYPPKPTSNPGYIEIIYSAIPPKCADVGDSVFISLDDIYSNVLLDYILYRALAKDNSDASNQKAIAYYQSFQNALGVKDQKEEAEDPNQNDNYKSPSYR